MRHKLKILPLHYQAIKDGNKRAEIRKDDRNFKTNDTLDLQEWDSNFERYTGRLMSVEITHILHGPFGGLAEGWCILSIA